MDIAATDSAVGGSGGLARRAQENASRRAADHDDE
jgi:hypothetical protein